MKQNLKYIIPAIILLLGIFGVFSHRFDLTKEKRYTLSDATVETLKSVKEPLTVEVYLEGDFPASFKQLQNETQFLLEEFRKINPKTREKRRISKIAHKNTRESRGVAVLRRLTRYSLHTTK